MTLPFKKIEFQFKFFQKLSFKITCFENFYKATIYVVLISSYVLHNFHSTHDNRVRTWSKELGAPK